MKSKLEFKIGQYLKNDDTITTKGEDMEKPDFKSVVNIAADHVRNEKLKLELSTLKQNVFTESNNAETNFEKLMTKLPSDIANDCALELENLLYAIGRLRGYSIT